MNALLLPLSGIVLMAIEAIVVVAYIRVANRLSPVTITEGSRS